MTESQGLIEVIVVRLVGVGYITCTAFAPYVADSVVGCIRQCAHSAMMGLAREHNAFPSERQKDQP